MAGSPIFFGEGSTPRVHDTRWRILQKILGATGGGGSGAPDVFVGSGPPAGIQPGQDGTIAATYYDRLEGFLAYAWDPNTQLWN